VTSFCETLVWITLCMSILQHSRLTSVDFSRWFFLYAKFHSLIKEFFLNVRKTKSQKREVLFNQLLK
jgi:hypothetical protein